MVRPALLTSARFRPGLRRGVVATLVTTLAATAVVSLSVAPSAQAASRSDVLRSAAAYGSSHGYKMGIAVYDTKTGKLYGSGYYKRYFASESVIKAMIATRLLLQGRMHGSTAKRAFTMITRSDDAIASAFYGSVGGDNLINWIKRHYHVPDLGTPPSRAGWWGNTHITAAGLVKFYAKVKKDRRVGPWLLNAMHHAKRYGSDGTYQFFGLPSATTGAAVKQGWGTDFDDWGRSADFNTTGFVNGDRYAVAILARGPARTYGSAIGNALTRTAKRLLPGGRFPEPNPVITHMTHRSGTTLGGQRITVEGTGFSGVSAVVFGRSKGTSLHVSSSTSLAITTPPHAAGKVSVRVVTNHGTSTVRSYYTYVRPPTITSLGPDEGTAAGGTLVTVRGTDFINVYSIWFRDRRVTSFKVISSTTLVATAPPGVAGPAAVRVHTRYGWTPSVNAKTFTYVAPPSVTAVTPGSGPATGGTQVTITGSGLDTVTAVRFGSQAGTGLQHPSSTTLTVVTPPGAAGAVPVVVQGKYGSSAAVPFTYTS